MTSSFIDGRIDAFTPQSISDAVNTDGVTREGVSLYARHTSASSHYRARVQVQYNGGNESAEYFVSLMRGATVLGSTSVGFAGLHWRFEVLGSTLTLYQSTDGATWSSRITRTDSNITTAGDWFIDPPVVTFPTAYDSPLGAFPGWSYWYQCRTLIDAAIVGFSLPQIPTLKAWGYLRNDSNDLRMAAKVSGSWVEIPRTISGTNVIFASQAGATNYACVIGNPFAGSPTTQAGTPVSGYATFDRAKRNEPSLDTRSLVSSQTVNDTTEHAFGADQTSGRGIGIKFTVSAGNYQFFEVLVRQRGTIAIDSGLMFGEVWTDNSGVPGTFVARGSVNTAGINKSTESFTWLPVFLPSKTALNGTYHFVPIVNGAGSATQAIDFGCRTVASGGTVSTRTRTGGTWGAWSAVSTKQGCIRVSSGAPALPGRQFALTNRSGSNPILQATGTPSWEQTYGEAGQNLAHLAVSQVHTVGNERRAVYASYSDGASVTGLNRDLGAAAGASLTALTKYNQAPLLVRPTSPSVREHHTPHIYDWTPGAYKMYYRAKYDTGQLGQDRHLRHASSTAQDWYTNQANGGWQTDGVVTYSWPTCVNVVDPSVAVSGGTTYVTATFQRNETTDTRNVMLRAVKTGTLTLADAVPVYIDESDIPSSHQFAAGAPKTTTDGNFHSAIVVQRLSGDGSAYIHEGWVASSADGLVYSSPYPLLEWDSGIHPAEELGADPSVGGIVSDTELVYAASRKYDNGAPNRVEVVTNLASIAITEGLIPFAPSNVTATLNGSQVDITWTDESSVETGYYVERRVGDGPWLAEATLPANSESHTDSDPTGGSVTYRVAAYSASGTSTWVESNTLTLGLDLAASLTAEPSLTATPTVLTILEVAASLTATPSITANVSVISQIDLSVSLEAAPSLSVGVNALAIVSLSCSLEAAPSLTCRVQLPATWTVRRNAQISPWSTRTRTSRTWTKRPTDVPRSS